MAVAVPELRGACASVAESGHPAPSVFSGVVVDSVSGDPLVGATLSIEGSRIGAFTRIDGTFEISNLVDGIYTVHIRYIGYVGKTVTVQVKGAVKLRVALAPSAVLLPEVSVTGSVEQSLERMSSQSIAVLSPEELDRHRGQTLGESLKEVPGVTVLQTGPSISKPVIRGLHSQRVRVINSGIAQEGQQWGGEHAPEIDPFSADRIEVMKGAAGVEFGAGAIGGVIRIHQRPLRVSQGFGGELTLNAFENNRQGAASLLLEGGLSVIPGVGWRAQGSVRKAGDSRTPEYGIGNSGFEELDGSLSAGYERGPVSMEASYSRFQTELGIYRGSHVGNVDDLQRAITAGRPPVEYPFTYDILAPKQEISHQTWSGILRYRIAGTGQVQAQLGWQSNHRQEYDAHRRWFDTTAASSQPAFDLTLTSYTLDVKFLHEPVGNFFGTVGVSGMRQTNVGNSLSFLIPNFRSYTAGVYAIEEWNAGPFSADAGLRIDAFQTRVYPYAPKSIQDTELRYTAVSGAVGARMELSPAWSIGATAGTAWRPPSVNELFSNGVHHGTAQFEIGDPLLTPERSLSLDVTIKHFGEAHRGELSVYSTTIDGYISLLPEAQPTLTLRGLFPTFRHVQTAANLRGFDGMTDFRCFDFLRVGASFALVRGVRRSDDEALFQMPADRARTWLHVHLPDLAVLHEPYLEVGITGVMRQTRIPAGADYLPPPAGYALVDIAFGSDLHVAGIRATLNASIRNLFNAAYRDYLSRFRYYINDPGRDIALRIQIPFGTVE